MVNYWKKKKKLDCVSVKEPQFKPGLTTVTHHIKESRRCL